MEERSGYQVITKTSSAPAGIDWLMIIAAKEAVRREKDLQEQALAMLTSGGSGKAFVYAI